MANLADILVTLTLDTSEFNTKLREAGQKINDFRNQVRQATNGLNGDFTSNIRDMSKTMNRLTNITQNAGQNMGGSFDNMTGHMNRTGKSSKYLSRNLGTSLRDTRKILVASTREFRNFGAAGMQVSTDIRDEFSALPKHLQRYVQKLREAGKSTEAFTRLNEMYSKRAIDAMRRSNDYMQKKTTQSEKLIKALDGQKMMGLSQQFLRLGKSMEETAKKGSVLNLALSRVGKNASLKQVQDEVKFISQGIMRAQSAFIGFGVATGLAVLGLVKMSNIVDGRLKPAFKNLKGVWLDALTPFVHAFTTFIVWIMKGATKIGELMKAFAKAHPQASQMLYGIILLTLAFGAMLAPLAVTGIAVDGLAASFATLWALIAPFVIGMLMVAGIAVLVAAAVVVLVAVFSNLWKASENLRKAMTNGWNQIKTTIINALAPIAAKWDEFKKKFFELMAVFTGGQANSMGDFWKLLGDKIAVAINFIVTAVLPILKSCFQIIAVVVIAIIGGLIAAMGWLAGQWKLHGDSINAVLQAIWINVSTAFGAVASFIASNMPQIQRIITVAFGVIKTIIGFVMQDIMTKIKVAMAVIWAVMQVVWPMVEAIIKSTWLSIKTTIKIALTIIEGVVGVIAALFKGDWRKAWDIAKNTVITIKDALTTQAKGMIKIFTDCVNKIKQNLSNMKNTAVQKMGDMKSGITSRLSGLGDKITKPFTAAWDKIKSIPGKIKDAFNKMIIRIPKPKLPSIGVGHKTLFGGKGGIPATTIPTLHWNAKGAIFNGASILGGGQAVGEAGAEAVLPLQHKRYMKPFASAIASHLNNGASSQPIQSGGNKYEIIFNEPVIIREDADIQRIVEELERRKKISERAKGNFSY